MIKIEILVKPTADDLRDINALLPQIAQRPHLLTLKELKKITAHKGVRVIAARKKIGQDWVIVGMSALTLVPILTGLIAAIEDVVVDERHRGEGIGRRLTEKMIALAKKTKAKTISLTTNPARVAANAMYQKLGFFKKDANYYRINLLLPPPSSAKELEKIKKYRDWRDGFQ
jgi:ribosomal protein S18 acetylase RimI-like enzyme